MVIGYAAFWVLFMAAVAIAVILWRNPSAGKRKPSLWLIFALSAISLALLISGLYDLRSELSVLEWPVIEGEIISSEVAGDRAFHPQISYSYEVAGKRYTGTSALNAPGFGGKRNRLEQAEILTAMYPPGSPRSVHFNPSHPAVSVLKTGVTYNTYLQLTFGTFLLAAALGWGIYLIRKK